MQENEIKQLLDLKENLEKLIDQKNNQIKILNDEIDNISKINSIINNIISSSSFKTADTLVDAETAAFKSDSDFKNLEYTKKIFSETKTLLAVLQFENDTIFIRFPAPELVNLSEEKYIENFVKPILMPLKKKEVNLMIQLTRKKIDDHEVIETISLQNIKSYDSFISITQAVKNLTTSQVN
ncbi:MAG: hypothetical protein ACTSWX_01445 [Promethearchaeota archaeon]